MIIFLASSIIFNCSNGEYLCEDKLSCIPDVFLCDGTEQCGDGSDESFCCELYCTCVSKLCQEMSRDVIIVIVIPVVKYQSETIILINSNIPIIFVTFLL